MRCTHLFIPVCGDILCPGWGRVCLTVCFPLAVDNLLRELPAEVSQDDTEDLHEIPGVPHPAERGSGSQGRTAQPTSLGQSPVLRLKLCQCSLGKNTLGDSCCQDVCPAAQSRAVGAMKG